jgi:hypothetical protein
LMIAVVNLGFDLGRRAATAGREVRSNLVASNKMRL